MPYKYRRSKPNGGWTPWQSSNVFTNVPAGTYTIQLKDDHNCSLSGVTSIPGSIFNPGNNSDPLTEPVILIIQPAIDNEIENYEENVIEEKDNFVSSKNEDLHLFPNPARNQLSVQKKDFAGKPVIIRFFNTLGIEVLHLEVDEMPYNPLIIDLDNFESGLYVLRIESQGLEYATKYFMVVK